MRSFTFPAAYRRHVEASLALTLAEIGRDVDYRDDEDHRVRAFAPVPDDLIDTDANGTITITLDH